MKYLYSFLLFLLVLNAPFAQPGGSGPGVGDPGSGSEPSCEIPCIDLSVHIFIEAEVINEFNGDISAIQNYVNTALADADLLLDQINVNLVLDGITAFFVNPWGNSPSECNAFRTLLGNQSVLFNHHANITYVFTGPKTNCFGAASGIGVYCNDMSLDQCGSDGSEGRDWIFATTEANDAGVTMAHEIGHILGSDDLQGTSGIMESNPNNRINLEFSTTAKNQICDHVSNCRDSNTPCEVNDVVSVDEVVPPCGGSTGCIPINTTDCMRTGLTIEDPLGIITQENCDEICYDMGTATAAYIVIKYTNCQSGTTSKVITFRACTDNFFPPNPPMEIANICCDFTDPSPKTVCMPFPDCVTAVAVNSLGQFGINVTTTNGEICVTPLLCLNRTYEIALTPTFVCGGTAPTPTIWTINVNPPEICPEGPRQGETTNGDQASKASLEVSPNPFRDELSFILNLPEEEVINGYRLFDINGREVYRSNQAIYSGQPQMINPTALATGMYYLSFETSQGRLVKKVIKQ